MFNVLEKLVITRIGGFVPLPSCKKAFTLAEVLLTIVIIGVVAAMTLPPLIANWRERQTVEKVYVFYSKISQATQRLIHEEGDPGHWLTASTNSSVREANVNILINKYRKYLKILTDCSKKTEFCVAPVYKETFSGTTHNFLGNSVRYNLILVDGSAVSFFAESTFKKKPQNRNKTSYVTIYYDVNGRRPPNVLGKDMFQFDLTEDGIYAYSDTEFRQRVLQGWYDSYWVVHHKNLDYLYCPNEIKKGAMSCTKKKKSAS